MADPHHHAVSSKKKWGGEVEDYLEIHRWFDASKVAFADFRHRALRHHTFGITECVDKFGQTIINSEGRKIPVRWVGEQHVEEDLGFIPTPGWWLSVIKPERWMNRPRRLSKELAEEEEKEIAQRA